MFLCGAPRFPQMDVMGSDDEGSSQTTKPCLPLPQYLSVSPLTFLAKLVVLSAGQHQEQTSDRGKNPTVLVRPFVAMTKYI